MRQELLLRREPFGGVLFIPDDATSLELDEEAFTVAHDWFVRRRLPRRRGSLRFLAGLHFRLGPALLRRVRYVDRRPPEGEGRLPVFASPTLVDFQITHKCFMNCPHCYASSVPEGRHTSLADARRVIRQLRAAGTCQVAIGGGEPLLHPDLLTILREFREAGMVPSLTTTGTGLNSRILQGLKRYCGAVALSLEDVGDSFSARRRNGFAGFRRMLDRLLAARIPTVLQVTLSRDNFHRLPAIVDFCLTVPRLYGVIFLAYKPVGRGRDFDQGLVALPREEVTDGLRRAFLRLHRHTRVGYDCCLTPGIVGIEGDLDFSAVDILEGCSAARSSLGISPELEVSPCTFTTHKKLGNLRRDSLDTIWSGRASTGFRRQFAQADANSACRSCASRSACLGGCPEFDLVICRNDYQGGRPG